MNLDTMPSHFTEWFYNYARPVAIKKQKAQTRNPDRTIVEMYWNNGIPYNEIITQTGNIIMYSAGAYSVSYDLGEG